VGYKPRLAGFSLSFYEITIGPQKEQQKPLDTKL
jgi:hypothetical protein